ncbi:serine/threonine-protein kinase Kist isoform X2 [Zootoca vivipara]|uniref:serine/threonine-protein kinase Kist isoform X2 n=1 Tax=Zootoca vivipara TaxID=8524 RepID=UPI00293C084D|nr:serine/threonine-protein kinase Kist isoform X2 [Zootoca vivipara]
MAAGGAGLWRAEAPLGRGSSAAVYRARCLGDPRAPPAALKAFLPPGRRGEGEEEEEEAEGGGGGYGFRKERAALEELRGHRSIVTLYGVFTDYPSAQGPSCCLLLELLDISVSELLAHSSVHGCSMWITQHCARDVLEGLAFLHHRGYVHADLKPRNILWSAEEEGFKLIDFGLSFKEGIQANSSAIIERIFASKSVVNSAIPTYHLRDLLKSMLHEDPQERATAAKALCSPFFSIAFAPHIEDLVMLPTPVLRLLNILSETSLQSEEEFEDIVDDIREECCKYGRVVSLFVPKENPGKGHVFVEYANAADSKAAQQALTGKSFDGKFVVATFYPLSAYKRGDLDQTVL